MFTNEEDAEENKEEWDTYDDYMKDAFDFEENTEDSLGVTFDAEFLGEMPISSDGDGVSELDFDLKSN